jgi:16S rRNA (cytosine1402-N4)-methyltransferase
MARFRRRGRACCDGAWCGSGYGGIIRLSGFSTELWTFVLRAVAAALYARWNYTAAMTDAAGHIPVLGDAVVEALGAVLLGGGVLLDCTAGRGGHGTLLLRHLATLQREPEGNPGGDSGGDPGLKPSVWGGDSGGDSGGTSGGRYIGIDTDGENVAFAKARLEGERAALNLDVGIEVVHANFAQARAVLDSLGVGCVAGVLADLGFASNQMADPARGLSFSGDGPLDMRLDPTAGVPAWELVNGWRAEELAEVIWRYGEERLSRKIARFIVEERQRSPILSTKALAEVVRRAYGRGAGRSERPRGKGHSHRIDPATRTFMALRIAVNGELDALGGLLNAIPSLLAPQGVAAIISFHSLEDRMVKHAFRDYAAAGQAQVLTRKPLEAGPDECDINPRSRSAKMRVLQWMREAPR